jgi:hypothetical protein
MEHEEEFGGSNDTFPIALLQRHLAHKIINWDNRMQLQSVYNLLEKGWNVLVEWKTTSFGVGVFAAQDVPSGTVLRHGIIGRNLVQFSATDEIEAFCLGDSSYEDNDYQSRLRYVSDYLWGFDPHADGQGYPLTASMKSKDNRFFGMWIPGNGLNHDNNPNTVYRPRPNGIALVALRNIATGQELYDDYRRHGQAPEWLREFAAAKQISLNFAECNDFVGNKCKAVNRMQK